MKPYFEKKRLFVNNQCWYSKCLNMFVLCIYQDVIFYLSVSIIFVTVSEYTPRHMSRGWRASNHGISPDSEVHGANMGPMWVLSAPDGPMLAPWTLLSWSLCTFDLICINFGADGFHWLNLQTRNCLPYKLWFYWGHHIGVPGIYSVYRSQTIWGPFSWHGLTLIAAWISNHAPSKLWDDITNPFPKCQMWSLGIDK